MKLGKILIILLPILIILGSCVLFLPMFNVTSIEIHGIDNLSEEDVRAMLTGKEGDNIILFNTLKCEKNIKQNNYVESVTVRRAMPSTVIVNITEYKLRAYIPYMGNYLYINDNGRVLDVRNSFTKQLPVLVGLKFDKFSLGERLEVENPEAYDVMVELSLLFEKYSLLGDIVKVDVSDTTDIHLYIDKIDVDFGSFENVNKKILTLIEVIKQLDTSIAGKLNLTGENASFEFLT